MFQLKISHTWNLYVLFVCSSHRAINYLSTKGIYIYIYVGYRFLLKLDVSVNDRRELEEIASRATCITQLREKFSLPSPLPTAWALTLLEKK